MGRRAEYFLQAIVLSVAMVAACAMPAAQAEAATDYPDVELAAFWNSDQDLSDTIYMSTNGVDFQKLSVAYQTDGDAKQHVKGAPSYVNALHDPGLFYVNGSFWMISGFVQYQKEYGGYRFTPMLGSSRDLVHWSYPSSGSAANLAPTQLPKGSVNGSYDTAGTDAMADSNGSVWIVTTLGHYGGQYGRPQDDVMAPYIVRADNVKANNDPSSNVVPDFHINYGSLVPIKLPDPSTNWLDPSLWKENGVYYLSIKKNGVTNQIYSISDLNRASDSKAWKLVCDNVVTGYEGPSLTKFKGQYFMYTDKLKDYPAGHADGKAGEFVTQSTSLSHGWHNTRRITTTDVNGRSIPNRHGSVLTVTDVSAKNVIWNLRERAGYGKYMPGLNGWQKISGKRYWYDEGVKAVSKEVYDPGSCAWYWFDKDGSMAHDKDAYIPSGDKWVRYDHEGHMIKGEDFRYGGWYYFDPVSGAMQKGVRHVNSSGGKWVYYDWTTGQMAHGERYLNYDSSHTGWYYLDPVTGAMFHGDTFVRSNGGKWVRYDRTTGQMVHGLQYQDGAWYYFDQVTGAMAHGNTYVPQWHSYHYFDINTGRG